MMMDSRQVRRQKHRRMIKEMSSLKYPPLKYRPVQKKGKEYPSKPLTSTENLI